MESSVVYARKDLQEFRQNIEAKLHETRAQLQLTREQLDGINQHIDQVNMSYGDDSRRHQQRSLLTDRLSRHRAMIRDLEQALMRIENGTYGICMETGERIARDRLLAKPTATLSIQAKERQGS